MLAREKIYEITRFSLGVNPTDNLLNESMLLEEDLGLDSVDQIEMTLQIEEEFLIDIDDEEMYSVKTVGDILDIVMKHLEEEDGKTKKKQ